MENKSLTLIAIGLSVVSTAMSVYAVSQRPDESKFVHASKFEEYKNQVHSESMNDLDGRLDIERNHRNAISDLIRKVEALEKQATPVSE